MCSIADAVKEVGSKRSVRDVVIEQIFLHGTGCKGKKPLVVIKGKRFGI